MDGQERTVPVRLASERERDELERLVLGVRPGARRPSGAAGPMDADEAEARAREKLAAALDLRDRLLRGTRDR